MALVIDRRNYESVAAYRDIVYHFFKHTEVTVYPFLVFELLYFIHIDSKNQSFNQSLAYSLLKPVLHYSFSNS